MINPKKSMVFLDASNLLGGWWTYCKTNGFVQNNLKTNRSELTKKIDYDKLIKEISADTDFIWGYYYDSAQEPLDSKKQGFFDSQKGNRPPPVSGRWWAISFGVPEFSSVTGWRAKLYATGSKPVENSVHFKKLIGNSSNSKT